MNVVPIAIQSTQQVSRRIEGIFWNFRIQLLCLPGLLALPKTSQQLTSLQLLESIKSPGSLVLRDEVRANLLVRPTCLHRSDPAIKVKRCTHHVKEAKRESTKEMHFNSHYLPSTLVAVKRGADKLGALKS